MQYKNYLHINADVSVFLESCNTGNNDMKIWCIPTYTLAANNS